MAEVEGRLAAILDSLSPEAAQQPLPVPVNTLPSGSRGGVAKQPPRLEQAISHDGFSASREWSAGQDTASGTGTGTEALDEVTRRVMALLQAQAHHHATEANDLSACAQCNLNGVSAGTRTTNSAKGVAVADSELKALSLRLADYIESQMRAASVQA
jgi:hypothetical protein